MSMSPNSVGNSDYRERNNKLKKIKSFVALVVD